MVHDAPSCAADCHGWASVLCYNSLFQQVTRYGREVRSRGVNRLVTYLAAAICAVVMAACGGNGNTSVTTPNGNTVTNPIGNLKNRAFISNSFSGNLQVV